MSPSHCLIAWRKCGAKVGVLPGGSIGRQFRVEMARDAPHTRWIQLKWRTKERCVVMAHMAIRCASVQSCSPGLQLPSSQSTRTGTRRPCGCLHRIPPEPRAAKALGGTQTRSAQSGPNGTHRPHHARGSTRTGWRLRDGPGRCHRRTPVACGHREAADVGGRIHVLQCGTRVGVDFRHAGLHGREQVVKPCLQLTET